MGDALREVERHALLNVERLEVGIRQQRRNSDLSIRGQEARDLLSRRPNAGGQVNLSKEESGGVVEIDVDFEARAFEAQNDVHHFCRHAFTRAALAAIPLYYLLAKVILTPIARPVLTSQWNFLGDLKMCSFLGISIRR